MSSKELFETLFLCKPWQMFWNHYCPWFAATALWQVTCFFFLVGVSWGNTVGGSTKRFWWLKVIGDFRDAVSSWVLEGSFLVWTPTRTHRHTQTHKQMFMSEALGRSAKPSQIHQNQKHQIVAALRGFKKHISPQNVAHQNHTISATCGQIFN